MNEIKIRGTPPLVIVAHVERLGEYSEAGPVGSTEKLEHYVMLSALPEHLKKQVVDAINIVSSGP